MPFHYFPSFPLFSTTAFCTCGSSCKNNAVWLPSQCKKEPKTKIRIFPCEARNGVQLIPKIQELANLYKSGLTWISHWQFHIHGLACTKEFTQGKGVNVREAHNLALISGALPHLPCVKPLMHTVHEVFALQKCSNRLKTVHVACSLHDNCMKYT